MKTLVTNRNIYCRIYRFIVFHILISFEIVLIGFALYDLCLESIEVIPSTIQDINSKTRFVLRGHQTKDKEKLPVITTNQILINYIYHKQFTDEHVWIFHLYIDYFKTR